MDNNTLSLRVPLVLCRNKNQYFHFTINRLKQNKDGWQSKNLSKAGKLVMIKAILQNLSIHLLSCLKLSSFVLNSSPDLSPPFGGTLMKILGNFTSYHGMTWPSQI